MTFTLAAKPAPGTENTEEIADETEGILTLSATDALNPAGRFERNGMAVYPNSLLFRAGEYKDVKFTATPEDLKGMATDWQPITGNIEHKQYLKGRAGVINKVWTEKGDTILRGEVEVPLGLDALLTDQERKISLEINRKTKRADKHFALTTNPRVHDAVLMSLDALESIDFGGTSRHDTPHGQRGMQELHDASVRYGAVCKADNAAAKFASEHENEAVQKVHDMACEHGAKCDKVAKPNPRPSYLYYNRDASEADKSKTDKNKPARFAVRARGAKPMPQKASLKERAQAAVRVLFAKSGVPEEDIEQSVKEIDFSWLDENSDKLDETTKALFSQVATLQKKTVEQDANAWAKQMLDDNKCLPSEFGPMVAAYLFAAGDDAANPQTINFSVGEEVHEVSRLDTIKALFSQRTPHTLFDEMLKTSEGLKEAQVLFSKTETARQGEKKPLSSDRRNKLLSATATGRALLAAEKGK